MTATLQMIPPAQIKTHKLNPRRAVGDVTDLAKTIAEQGILEPLIVAPDLTSKAAKPQFMLIAGHRRLAGSKLAKLTELPCVVRDDLTDPGKQIEAMLVENLHRADLTPVEEADAFQMLLEYPGYTHKSIAESVGRTPALVRSRLKIAALPDSTKNKVHTGQIRLEDAAKLAQFTGTKWQPALEKAIGTYNWYSAVTSAEQERDGDRRTAKAAKDLAAAKVRVLDKIPLGHMRLYSADEIEAHRKCPGFAAVILQSHWDRGRVAYLCDQPGLHASDDDDDLNPPAEVDPLLAQLEAAADERRTYLAELINTADVIHGGRAHKILVAKARAALKGVTWASKLFLEAPDDVTPRELSDAIADLDVAQLVLLVDVLEHADKDRGLVRRDGYGSTYSYGDYYAKWRERLVEIYDYEWTDAEKAAIDDIAAQVAAKREGKTATSTTQPASDDDEGYDEGLDDEGLDEDAADAGDDQ